MADLNGSGEKLSLVLKSESMCLLFDLNSTINLCLIAESSEQNDSSSAEEISTGENSVSVGDHLTSNMLISSQFNAQQGTS